MTRRAGASWAAALAVIAWSIAAGALRAGDLALIRDCAECPEMLAIPAGSFVMGAAPGEEQRESLSAEFRNRSQPPRTVSVREFLVGKFEITRAQFRAFVEATGRRSDGCFAWDGNEYTFRKDRSWLQTGYHQDDAHPAACVSWEDASAYAAWLTQRTGRKYRLLTEAEWEYAARAGTATSRYWGDDPARACDHANGADLATHARVPGAGAWHAAPCNDRYAYTAPVGSYRPNAFGLHDMLGNVAEWTQDCLNADYTGAPNDGRAWLAGDCALRMVRGGAWDDPPVGVRAAYRVGSPVTVRVYARGFRVARDR